MFVLLLAAANLAAAYDLYLPSHEVSTLLGLSRELYYVSAGEVRENALQFTIPISDDVNKLYFVWKSPDENVRYDIKISTSDPDALRQPHLNGNTTRIFPIFPEHCLGYLPIYLYMYIQGDPSGGKPGLVDFDFGCSTILLGQ